MIETFVLTSVATEAEGHASLSSIVGIINSNYQIDISTHPKVPILANLELTLKYIYTVLHCMLFFP